MAKVNVIFGQLRGKVGGVVFRHDPDGFTVASEYNAQPSNPRTMEQTKQRNKMSLAGQISKLVPKQALLGMDANSRKARSMFVSNLLKNISGPATITPGTQASSNIAYADVKFSKGAPVGDSPRVLLEGTTLNVGWPDETAHSDSTGGIAVVLFVKAGEVVATGVQAMTAHGSDLYASFDVSRRMAADSYAACYAIPISTTDEELRTAYNNAVEANNDVTTGLTASVLAQLALKQGYRDSVFCGYLNLMQ